MTQQQPPSEPKQHPQREHCTKEGLCSWTFDFKGKPCNKNCSSDSRKKPSEYRCETCDNSIIGKDQDGYTHRHCKHPEMQYRGSDSVLLLGTEITHIQDHGCVLHPKMAERIAILEANIERKDNDIVVLTGLCAANTDAQDSEHYTGACAIQDKCMDYADFVESIMDEIDNEDDDIPCPIKCEKRANPHCDTDAQARIDAVVKELEEREADLTKKSKESLQHDVHASNCYASMAIAYEKAIALLKEGVGK